MAEVNPQYFNWGQQFQQGMDTARQRTLQDIAFGQQQEDRSMQMQDRQRAIASEQAKQGMQQAESQYAAHIREAQTLYNVANALKKVPAERRRQALEQWGKQNPIIAGALQHVPPETDLSDPSLDEFASGMSAALGGFQQGSAVQSVEMDENGNLFIIDRQGGIKQAINPQTGQPIIGRKPQAQIAGKRIVEGVDAQGNPTFQVVDLGAGEQPTIKPKPNVKETTTTEAERKAAGFYDRMKAAAAIVDSMEAKGYDASNMRDALTAGEGLKNYLATPEGQNYYQAQANWVRANLRKESGAVIGEDEMKKEIQNYFPQPGDKENVIAQKRQNRKLLEQNMLREAGRAYSAPAEKPSTQQSDEELISKYLR